MLKRMLSLLLTLVLCLGILAGCKEETPAITTTEAIKGNGDSTTTSTTDPAYKAPGFDGWKLTMYMPNNKDLEVEGSYANKLVEEHLNMDWEVVEFDSFTNQYSVMIADKNVPSLTFWNSMSGLNDYGSDGVYINIYEHLDKMPNVKRVLEDPQWAEDVARFTYEEGVMYGLPIPRTGGARTYGYIYCEDVFEANNITFPTTQEEFHNMLLELKRIYPDSYPFVLRWMTKNMQGLEQYCFNWGAYHVLRGYHNTVFQLTENGEYICAQTSDSYKQAVTYLKSLLDQGLMHPSTMTIDNAGWSEAIVSGTSFVTYDSMEMLGQLNKAGQAYRPDFHVVGAAPIAMGTNGTTMAKNALGATGYSFTIGNNAELEKTLQFVDWLYSEEGITMTNWGKEGESYTVNASGEKEMNKEWVANAGGYTPSGLGVQSICGYIDFDAYLSALSDPDEAASIELCLKYRLEFTQKTLVYNEEEKLVWDTYSTAFFSYANAEVSKFILGTRDLSTWDQVEQELKDNYHYDDLMAIHKAAYARTQG